ncbi:MAG: pilus assembly protein [Marinicaulis sp.]|nr:pilus assembly protein [Marinicaulis sp.]NNL89719.1 pilus assembly protein [Marinicaulis sp.]
MNLFRKIRKLIKNRSGAALVEFTLVSPLLFITTFGILEFSNVMWQYQQADIATRLAVRLAATRDSVVTGLPDCGVATSEPAGTDCADVSGSDSWSVSCNAGSPGGSCNAATIARIMTEIHKVNPNIPASNVQIEYSGAGLGFVGLGRPVPIVTVRVTNLTANYIAIGNLVGFANSFTMPDFVASIPAEDLTGT